MATIKEAPTLYVTVPNGYPTERQQPFNYSQQLLQTNLLSPTTAAAMANKFEKEEKFEYDSNTDSDSECNNSKSRSGSNSPTAEFEERVFNDTTGRSGGPNAEMCDGCRKSDNSVQARGRLFECQVNHKLCDDCANRDTCPLHPQARRN
ncbi:uncharacterized protein LOC135346869 isoform X3 [Halichondria panicea]|uniref:uncharacterized protein LOC135346869 isoform X3 n=1 Tax=Halichondria panicea TaxID=6063 RepID=UPI00312B5CFA